MIRACTTFAILWQDQKNENGSAVDFAHQEQVRKCRDKLLPSLGHLSATQGEAFDLLGMEREDLPLEVIAVDSQDERLEKAMKRAAEQGLFFDLCDSDEEDDDDLLTTKPAAQPTSPAKVTPEAVVSYL